ncbi:hypothetical protein [Aeromicrobium sp.]|uniref:hypothetical protein n=1 Tax=Aeromicrobium sp. TaxID=1871063 RepID=UPI0040345CAD
MTEENETPTVERDEPDSDSDNLSFARPDSELEVLVRLSNKLGLGMSITLTTPGGIVAGELCSYKEFWNGTAERFENMSSDNEGADEVAKALAQAYRDRATDFDSESDEDDDEEQPEWPPRYIHLRNTRIHDGHQYLTGALWRGRLAQVAGWSFGRAE